MFKTISEANDTFCLRIDGQKCGADQCMAWRWEQVTTSHPNFKAALQKKAIEFEEKAPFPKAAKYVSENKEEFGLVPTRGFCGLAGEPK